MRGRRPAGPEYVARLNGSDQAKQRLQVILEVMAGRCRVQEACLRLQISEPRFHQLRSEVLQAALGSLEPQTIGRPPQPPADERVQALETALAQMQGEVHAAQVREEIALVLGSPQQAARDVKKKRRQRQLNR